MSVKPFQFTRRASLTFRLLGLIAAAAVVLVVSGPTIASAAIPAACHPGNICYNNGNFGDCGGSVFGCYCSIGGSGFFCGSVE